MPKFWSYFESGVRSVFCPKRCAFLGTGNGGTPPPGDNFRSLLGQTRFVASSTECAPQSGVKMRWKRSVALSAKPVTVHSPLAFNNKDYRTVPSILGHLKTSVFPKESPNFLTDKRVGK